MARGSMQGAPDRPGAELEADLLVRLQPWLAERGYDLVEVTYRREQRGWVLRCTVDRPGGGLTVDDAARLTRELGAMLEADGEIDGRLNSPYHLEVSSPGIFRPLKRVSDFERAWEKRARVYWQPEPGRVVELVGTIKAVGDGRLRLVDETQGEVEIPLDAVVRARLDPKLPFGR